MKSLKVIYAFLDDICVVFHSQDHVRVVKLDLLY